LGEHASHRQSGQPTEEVIELDLGRIDRALMRVLEEAITAKVAAHERNIGVV
jgi:hypothetical protein